MSSSLSINSNLASLSAQRRLGQTTQGLQQSFTRLSSGLRINKASDDAAGLAIAESLNADARVFNQGIRNLNDGVSLTNIADSALESLTTIVIRLEELAEQAANGTLGSNQRDALDEEAQALSREYFRIARSTEFNNQQLLDGTIGDIRIQGGYGETGGIVSGFGGAIGTGSFGAASSLAASNNPYSVALGDLNGDGMLDLITADTGTGQASVVLGNGDGSFRARASFATSPVPISMTIGDVNSDGVLDLATTDWIDSTASVMLGNGDGSFRARSSFATSTHPFSVAFGDLNGDGMPDLITADWDNNQASVMLGNGDGSFRARSSFATATHPTFITRGDLNGDGILDLATAGNEVSVLLGNGNGSFRARASFSSGSTSVALGDVNGDSVLDLATADGGFDRASVMLGNGNGTFRASSSFTTGSSPNVVALGDINGDGVLDVITVDYVGNQASVMLGNGDGSFRARASFATGTHPCAVTLGDINGDGALDFATADYGASRASVFLATTKDGVSPLLPFDLTTLATARQALAVFQQKLDQLSAQRGEIGAFQSRLAVAINTLSVAHENYLAAKSQITDADVAEESAQLIKQRILQEAGTAVLAQANMQPEIALTLLRGA